MKFRNLNTDEAILEELGRRLKTLRASLGQNQSDTADLAMLSRSTVSKIENGHATQTPEFFRYAKVVGLLDLLEEMLPEETVSPVSVAKKGNANLAKRRALKAHFAEKFSGAISSPKTNGGFVWPEDMATGFVSTEPGENDKEDK